MRKFQSVLIIPDLLTADQLSQIDQMLGMARFVDGKVTATAAARLVKQNLQIDPNQNAEMLERIILSALFNHELIREIAMPRYILPPTFSKYQQEMTYGYHVDNPLMSKPNHPPLRTDLACTVFLSAVDSYEGGELEIIRDGQHTAYKLERGGAVIYPTQYVHRVNPIIAGERLAAVTWMQSMVRDTAQREILHDLKALYEEATKDGEATKSSLVLLQSYSNLMKMWAEL